MSVEGGSDKPLRAGGVWPVVILADVSGSMGQDGKIDALNASLRALIEACLDFSVKTAPVEIAVVAFGGGTAQLVVPFGPAAAIQWQDATTEGTSPLAEAIDRVGELILGRAAASADVLQPLLVLMSDGSPTDATSWPQAMRRFDDEAVTRATERVAIAIGPDADLDMLEDFVRARPGARVFRAGEEPRVLSFFTALPIDPGSGSVRRDARPGSAIADLA